MKKTILAIGMLPLMFVGCGMTLTEEVKTPTKTITKKDIIKIESKNLNRDILIHSAKCEKINLEDISSHKEITRATSTTEKDMTEKYEVFKEEVKEGIKYSIEYCKSGDEAIDLSIDLTFYNKPIVMTTIIEDKKNINLYSLEEYSYKSNIRLLKDTPIVLDNLKITWISTK